MKKRGAFIVPTFSVMGAIRDGGREMGITQTSLDKMAMIIDRAYEGLEVMQRAGLELGFGTDLLAEQHTRGLLASDGRDLSVVMKDGRFVKRT